ncbi:MAG: endonuclease [Thermoleophilia bacterium]|nr:endonuclease [Thermoleophilia bacterium]MCZ4496231.1 endonuclease [Thermoleophilia bacterium]
MSAQEKLPPVAGERISERRARTERLMQAFHEAYPDAHCALTYETPFQLLIATILSAQCTDARVNEVTPALFDAYPDARSMAAAPIADLERLVMPTGFFRQKAKNLLAGAQRIVDVYDGEIPETVEELATIPGAARKTANVVVSNCFPENAAGIAVDTHVQRIARRLGITRQWEPPKIEAELMKFVSRDHWNMLTHLMIDHGRAICKAPIPRCDECPLAIASECPSQGRWDARRPRA